MIAYERMITAQKRPTQKKHKPTKVVSPKEPSPPPVPIPWTPS